jgi:hypothetical protein
MAGLTVTRVAGPYSIGDRWQTVSTATFDSSYLTDGESLTKAQLGFASTTDPEFNVTAQPTAGYVAEYDHTNSKLLLYWVDTTVDGAALAQVASTTDVSAVVVRVVATGKFRA